MTSASTRPAPNRWAIPATGYRSTPRRAPPSAARRSGAGNVISANAQAGCRSRDPPSTGTAILGNFIGTDYSGHDRSGQRDVRRGRRRSTGVTIGGTAAGDRNIISGNTGAGIGLVAGATGELVEGNFIGTDITGSNPLGNGTGILIDGGSANNTIGGTRRRRQYDRL